MNAKIGDLTASDFPGIDEAKFNEWKARAASVASLPARKHIFQ